MVVIADPAGGLGNKLLLSAHLIAASCATGFQVLLPPFGAHHRFFPGLDDAVPLYPSPNQVTFIDHYRRRLLYLFARIIAALVTRLRLPANRWFRVIRLEQGDRFDLSDASARDQLQSARLVVLQGWLFRDTGSLTRHASVVRGVLSPTADVLARAGSLVDCARGDAKAVVGIHIRQGDYRQHLGGRFFFHTDRYITLMEQLIGVFSGNVRFLVTTDSEQDWSRFAHLPYSPSNGNVLVDLFALAGCDYLCGPPSSFTLWASFYGHTPLGMMVSGVQVPTLDDFYIAPEIPDPAVAALY